MQCQELVEYEEPALGSMRAHLSSLRIVEGMRIETRFDVETDSILTFINYNNRWLFVTSTWL